MQPVLKKLAVRDQRELLVIDAPESFEAELSTLQGPLVRREAAGAARLEFALVFVRTLERIESHARELAALPQGDAVLWFAYPKAASKKYRCEFNRDTGWAVLGALGYEPVSQVAIDEDWSALRFRKVEYIKTMVRDPDGTLSEQGRAKVLSRRQRPERPA